MGSMITDEQILAKARTLSTGELEELAQRNDSQRLRKAASQVLAERRAEALTLDCPEPAQEVPAQRIREAVNGAARSFRYGMLVQPLDDEVPDDEIDRLVDAIAAAVVEVLGGEA